MARLPGVSTIDSGHLAATLWPPQDPQNQGPSQTHCLIGSPISPSYPLVKQMQFLLSPLERRTDSHVRGTEHFVAMMREVRMEEDEMLVSFDVSYLFPNVPVDEVVQVICDSLQVDETCDRTRLAELLKVCPRSTYISFGGAFYAMVANLYMEFFETLALSTPLVSPGLWKSMSMVPAASC